MRTEFLNVDLDLQGDVSDLLPALGSNVITLRHTTKEATLELAVQPRSADDAIRRIADVIRKLPISARSAWDGCIARRMNEGIQGGDQPHEAQFNLSLDALTALVDLRAEVIFTVYSAGEPSDTIEGAVGKR